MGKVKVSGKQTGMQGHQNPDIFGYTDKKWKDKIQADKFPLLSPFYGDSKVQFQTTAHLNKSGIAGKNTC